jgi:uncharacterized protein (TIGR03435 family)
MQTGKCLALLIGCLGASSGLDDLPKFEVASVKPMGPLRPGTDLVFGQRASPERVVYRAPLGVLVKLAFDTKRYQLSAPAWLDSDQDLYEIQAKILAGEQKDQISLMLRDLLIDRFNLMFHVEDRDVPAYELVRDKKGPGLHESAATEEPKMRSGPGHVEFKRVSIAEFADSLALLLRRPVVDRTGIAGYFNVSLDWSPDDIEAGSRGRESRSGELPTLPTAIREQLGLALVASKALMPFVVVDHVEKAPRGN